MPGPNDPGAEAIRAAAGEAGNSVQVHSVAVDRLAAVSRKLRADVKAIRDKPLDNEYKVAANFFGSIRALAGIVSVLAEQPGYRPTDAEGAAVKQRMAPLKAKMDEITKQVESKVNFMTPLSATAPQRWEDRAADAGRLAGIVLDPQNADDIREVSDDKSIPPTWKAMFFNELGKSIHEAMVEILRTKHEDKIFDAVNSALDARTKNTMIGACVWASQAAASAAGNLPGPNSLYVGIIRMKAANALRTLKTRTPNVVLDDILPHWFDALKLSASEQADFTDALKEFKENHTTALTAKDSKVRDAARDKAESAYKNRLLKTANEKGTPQSGWKLSTAMSSLNLLCLIAVWEATPDFNEWSARNWADVGVAGVTFGVGAVATFAHLRANVSLLQRLEPLGKVIGYFAALVSVVEGFSTVFSEALPKHDWWLLGSGAAQMGSGICIAVGVSMGSPGWQLAGLVLGLAASAIAIIDDAVTDKMKAFIHDLIKDIKSAISTWDNSPLMRNLGLTNLVDEFEKLVESCQVTELAYNRNWTGPGGLVISHDVVHDRLNMLGIKNGLHRERLCQKVWAT